MRNRHYFLKTSLFVGFAFFYVPIISMIVFSFNKSPLVGVWAGFSMQWYWKLLNNRQVLQAALLSLEIAFISATLATVLGTMAGIALTRFRKFRGKMAFSGLVLAPLVMPEVITGISTLMLFILMGNWIGWPEKRGMTTVTIAHVTFSIAFVSTIVRSRLSTLDESLEEAAMDLGSRPWQVMKDVTLPIIWPAIVSAWLLAFTISLDNVVITSFTTGPGATTLPLYVWSKIRVGVTPDINALASVIIVFVGILVGVAGILMSRAERRRESDRALAQAEDG